ncbi:MAG: 3-oxoacid CoA-transferase subunit B [Candidatus Bathyarchaeota archaeon B23]|nr:MAG: 3-oxoacid CoA-transferase subunit B [Candidatus Bathyarchaeota archaeon B23]
MSYNPIELMACVASRLLRDARSVFVGTGLPMVAAVLAQRLHAPDLLIVFEAGGIGPQVPTVPISVGDSRTFHRAVMATSMDYVMSIAQLGFVEYGFLGAAQIDPYGNLNTTVIGPHERPRVRLPGSGGANDVGSLCWRTIILMRHERRRFVESLDFLTTPGYLTGPGARERVGLPADTGPYRVITQLAVLGFDEETKRMKLLSLHPGVSMEEVMENTGFELIIPEEVSTTQPPTEEELRLLRGEIDPAGIVIGRAS